MRPGLKLYSVEERGEFWVNFFLLTLKTICSKYVGNASFFFVAFELVLKSKNTIYAPVEEMIIWKTNAWNHWLFPKTDWKLTTKFRSHTEESKHNVLLIPLKKGQNYFFPISRMHFKYSSQKNIDKNPTIETSKKKNNFLEGNDWINVSFEIDENWLGWPYFRPHCSGTPDVFPRWTQCTSLNPGRLLDARLSFDFGPYMEWAK